MIDDLLKRKLISLYEYETYMLFGMGEMGQRWLSQNTKRKFMETPKVAPKDIDLGQAFAFQDGMREPFREIHLILERINNMIQEESHDRSSEDGTI